MFKSRLSWLVVSLVLSVGHAGVKAQEAKVSSNEPVFSGPQLGESLPGFKAHGLSGDLKGKEFDPIADADGKPVTLIFFHELTRPGFGLMRAITQFAEGKKDKGLRVSVVFLTDDPTATGKWAQNVQSLFYEGVQYGMSMEGKEGPGAYGLNRNMTLTVLVGSRGKVTGNFALLQPQLQSDGPGILKAIAEVTGGGDVPSMTELETRYAGRTRMSRKQQGAGSEGNARRQQDPQLASLLRSVINKQASDEEVRKAASRVDEYVAGNETARKELLRRVTALVNSERFTSYGTAEAQKVLQEWSKKYGSVGDSSKPTDSSGKE